MNRQPGPVTLEQGTPPPVPSTPAANIGSRVANAAAWMVMLRFAVRGIGIVSQLIMVRLLTSEDFGLIASSTVIYSMLDMLSDLPVGMAVMQTPNPRRSMYDTAWTIGVLRGMLISVLLWFAAPILGEYMRDSRVTGIVHVLAIAPFLQGFESTGMITLQQDLKFQRLFFYRLLNKALGFTIAVPIAIIYQNYWALVFGGFASRFVTIPLSYVVAPYRPRLSLKDAPALFHFSKWLVLNNILTMVDVTMMTMCLGRLGTQTELGLYRVSADLAAMPASEIAAPIRGPMYAGYAKVAQDIPALRGQVVSGFALMLMVVLPMSVGIAVTSDLSVPIVLGAKWTGAAPVMTWCALWALFDALGHFTGNIYIIRNAQRSYVGIMAAGLAMRLAMVVPAAIYGGVVPATQALALSALANAFLWLWPMCRLISLDVRTLLRDCWRSLCAAACMTAGVLAAQALWPVPEGAADRVTQWLAVCLLGAAIHAGAQMLLWHLSGRPVGPELHVVAAAGRIGQRLRRLF